MLRLIIGLCVVLLASPAWAVEYYLSPIDGAGTEDNPYRSRCLGTPGGANIDLRLDSTSAAGFMLCKADALPGPIVGVIPLGTSLDAIVPGRARAAVATTLGRAFTGSTVRDAVISLVEPRLHPGRDGKLKIFLGNKTPVFQQTAWVPFRDGGMVADAVNAAKDLYAVTLGPAVAWAAASLSENFNCADSSDPSCQNTITEFQGTAWGITSNEASATSSNSSDSARIEVALDSVDHEATFQVTSMTQAASSNLRCGALIRKDNTATLTYYRLSAELQTVGEANRLLLQKYVAGSSTTLGTDDTDWVNTEILKLGADGDTIYAKRDGSTTISVTDTSITTGSYVGLRYSSNASAASCTLDDFSATVLATPTPRRGKVFFQ